MCNFLSYYSSSRIILISRLQHCNFLCSFRLLRLSISLQVFRKFKLNSGKKRFWTSKIIDWQRLLSFALIFLCLSFLFNVIYLLAANRLLWIDIFLMSQYWNNVNIHYCGNKFFKIKTKSKETVPNTRRSGVKTCLWNLFLPCVGKSNFERIALVLSRKQCNSVNECPPQGILK